MAKVHGTRIRALYPVSRQRRDLLTAAAEPFPNDSTRLPVPEARPVADEQWACFFNGRAGARAQAVFGSKEEARQFANRHARYTTPRETPLKWEDTNKLTTQLGDYMIVPLGDH
jgi:hypothetical protein